jgi:regulator of protease activity HflC (stomatin/prohibitin superfamily)
MFKALKRKWKWGAFFRNLSVTLLLFIIVIILLYKKIFISIAPGEVGVEYDFLEGTKMYTVYEDGLNIISPFNSIIKYSSRVQKLDFEQEVLTRDGLKVNINHEILYQLNTEYCPICRTAALPKLHVTLGPNFEETVLKPNALSYMRRFIGGLLPEDIFMKQTGLLEKNNKDHLSQLLIHSHIDIISYFITKINLPSTVDSSIAAKFQAEQLNEEYDYKLAIEEKEAKRKTIEAQGLKSFTELSGVSPVQWKALDVTLRLANSNNSKLIITGNTSQTLPLLFSDQMSLSSIFQNGSNNIKPSKNK